MKKSKIFYSIVLSFILSISFITVSQASNDQVKHFLMSNIQNDYGASTIMNNTVSVFNKLGYNNVSNNGSGGYETTSISAVNNYIHVSGNNYAFSFFLDEAMIENVCTIDLDFYTQKKNEIIID